MATAKKPLKDSSTADEVADFRAKLDHPLKAELEAVRSIILGAHPAINEGIKWNAPSFRVNEYFATANIRKDAIQIVFHLGAKVKDNSTNGVVINDSAGLLEWHAKDRASVKFRDLDSIKAQQAALAQIVREWITHLN